jgi:hypothetical protein
MRPNPDDPDHDHPSDDPHAAIYIEAYHAALPASPPTTAEGQSFWSLAAHAAAVVAIVKAMTAPSTSAI